ncbi:kinase-like domain-containing protein [Gigaspora rosea]|uniref:Kinase-like domain-containing protein n=1 Tax=Gigaspora rosea TaxID=44941 RepID=A0A397VE93_9GLOM|nr:kinase-like domain-containing protein [Gigaspora rosea]
MSSKTNKKCCRDKCSLRNCSIRNLFYQYLFNYPSTRSTGSDNVNGSNSLTESAGSDNVSENNCPKCGCIKLYDEWCEICEHAFFKSNFQNWTSGNEIIDNFIRDTQLLATTKFNYLEWIPYSSLNVIELIGRGGFGEVHSAMWIDGPRTKWNTEKKGWERYSNVKVAIKKIVDTNMEDFTELFKELKAHLMSNNQVVGRFNVLRAYGITYNPETKKYMMVMTLADDGDLSDYLQKHFSTLTYIKQIEILYDIAIGLTQIHKSGLIHRDLHCRNVMCQGIKDRSLGRGEEYRFVIGDLGHATLPIKDIDANKVFGVLPYIAPEILGKKQYTQAADVYSFGILMWEILTGLKAFGEFAHDSSLINRVYSGSRPEIPSNTPKLYADLMKKCWCKDIKERPSAHELYMTIGTWLNQCLYVPNSKIAKELKKCDELRSRVQQQELYPNNFPYSTTHDVSELLESIKYELPEMPDLEIPESLNN